MTEPIRHIVFDIGKVLVHYDPNLPYLRIIPDAEERAAFFATVCTSDWNLEQDRGRSWPDGEALLIARYPEREAQIRAFRRHWAEMVPHAYGDSVAIMTGQIDAGRDVTLLTNFAADTFIEARQMFSFLDLPRGGTVSGQIGLIKPEVAIYDRHAQDFGLEPRHTVFIDDVAATVEGARAAGWQAILFTGAGAMKAERAALGVEVEL